MKDTGTGNSAAETDIAAFHRLLREMDALAARMLERARAAEPGDRKAGAEVLGAAAVIGRAGQGCQGRVLLMLAQAQRIGAVPGGLDTWISTHLDVTRGSALGMAKQAKALGAVAQLAGPLASGRVGAGTISALTRTARALRHEGEQAVLEALAGTLEVASRQGVDKAKRHVQVLEETLSPGRAGQSLAKARERSFLRVAPSESGMCRIEALLDPERATIVRAMIDQAVSAFLRARQYDGTDLVPEDVRTIEQLQAEALVRMAQNFAHTDPATRQIPFTAPTLYTAPLDPHTDAGLAESVYATMLPREILPPPGHHATSLLEYDAHGAPVFLDNTAIDQNSAARLASPAQRTALAWRDRTCTHPGCHRPPTYSLHAHHHTPYSHNGPTTLANLTLLCATHHTLTHHPAHHNRK